MVFRTFANLSPPFRGLSPLQIKHTSNICRCHSDTKSLAWGLERLPLPYVNDLQLVAWLRKLNGIRLILHHSQVNFILQHLQHLTLLGMHGCGSAVTQPCSLRTRNPRGQNLSGLRDSYYDIELFYDKAKLHRLRVNVHLKCRSQNDKSNKIKQPVYS